MYNCFQITCLLKVITVNSIPDKMFDTGFYIFQQQDEELPEILNSGLVRNKLNTDFQEDTTFPHGDTFHPDSYDKYLHGGGHHEHEFSMNDHSTFPTSEEYSDENPIYVLPPNEDPNVPNSDVLDVDPFTLEAWHDGEDSRFGEQYVPGKNSHKSKPHQPKHDPYREYRHTRNSAIHHVIPANEDPLVPSSDILSVDPITLEVTHVEEIPVLDKWVIDYSGEDVSQENLDPYDPDVYCGDKVYNPRHQICCKIQNGQTAVWDNPNSLRMGCCGINAYNTATQWCCEGSTTIVRAQHGRGNGCCGPQGLPFHYLKQKCCPSSVKSYLIRIPKTDQIGSSSSYSCCSVANSTRSPPKLYQDMNQVCCNGVIGPIFGRGTVCCGERPFLLKTSSCCANKFIYNSTSELKCCNKEKMYNSRTHVCCGNTAILKTSPGDKGCCDYKPYNPATHKCCRDWNDGREIMSPKRHLFESCCGVTSYNTQEKMCCGRTVVSKKMKYSPICRTIKENRIG